MNKLIFSVAAAAAIGAIGGAYWLGATQANGVADAAKPGTTPPSGNAPGKAAPGGPPPQMVEAASPVAQKLPVSITTVGTLRSDESVILRPEIAGRIAAIQFREGQRVAKGSVLVKLDAALQAAELEQARANASLAKTKYERSIDLQKKGFISPQALDEAQNNLKVAEAALNLSTARIARTEIRAPFSGIVGLRSVSVGDYVREGQDMVNLEEVDPLKADFRVPEIYLKQVQSGQPLQVTLDAIPNKTFLGKVLAVNPQLDSNGRSLVVRAIISNTDAALRPGMFARVRLLTDEVRDSLLITEDAVFPVGDDKFVFKIVDGRAQRQKVDIGQRRDGKVEVLAGIAASDRIVTQGQFKIREGTPVRTADAKAAPGNAPSPTATVPATPAKTKSAATASGIPPAAQTR